MKEKMPLREHVFTILSALVVAAVYGYFRTLRHGDVEGYIRGIILAPALVWGLTVLQFRYRTRRQKASAEKTDQP